MRIRLLALLLLLPALANARARVRVLIIDGINNHDWQTATRELKAMLLETGRFTVDVSSTPPAGAPAQAWAGWRPHFSRYQVVTNNFNGGYLDNGIRWPPEVERSFERYVRQGGGLVVFHAANNAFLHWAAYNDMIGLGWRDKNFGPGLSSNLKMLLWADRLAIGKCYSSW